MKAPWILFISLLISVSAGAQDQERSFTFDLSQPSQAQTIPPWMTGQPSALPSVHASISFPVAPPGDQSDLAATFYFTESMGGFLRVYWAGGQSSAMLSDNLFEGIAMPNQRTLLIKRSSLSSSGTLTVQSSETTLDVSRIHFEWVEPATVSLADGAKQSVLVNATGGVFTEGQVNGAPLLPQADDVRNSVITAPLTDRPVRIEAGVEFVATLQAMPQYARLEVKVSGAPLGNVVQLILNGATVGDISMDVPDLNDAGYQTPDPTASPVYFGWRKGVIFVPAAQLKVGDNQFQVGLKDVVPSGTASPLAVKDLVLQLKYPEQPAATPTPAPGPAAAIQPAGVPDLGMTISGSGGQNP